MSVTYQPGFRVSEYLLEERLGGGTFGEVWRARHHVWDSERVAIKLPTESEYVRFLRQEGVVVHGLRHANIVRVIGFDPYADPPYLVMELVRGPSLRQVLDEHPEGLPIDVALVVLRGLLQAMAVAHEGRVIHRDLKPGNVMLDLHGRPLDRVTVNDVKVGDFGLGFSDPDTLRSVVMQSASIARDEESAAIAGTLAYMAPELRESRRQPEPRSDLYSIGIILFEMLTGERPAGAELPSALRAEVPGAMDEIFRGLYARYDRRYEDARAVLQDIDSRLGPPPERVDVRVPPAPPPLPAERARARAVECPHCRATVDARDQFCTQCGKQLVDAVRRCGACGGWPARDDRYCIYCGAALEAASA